MPRKPVLKAKQNYTQTIYKAITCDGNDQDAETNVTVHHDATLKAIHYAVDPAFTTTADFCVIELSESGNYQADTSDNPDSLAVVMSSIVGTAANSSKNGSIENLNIPFIAGDKIYINSRGTNTRVVKAMFILVWE